MINYLLRSRVHKVVQVPPCKDVIDASSKVLFSLFTRYGDTIISLVVIKEFIDRHPDKEYLILSPKQMRPYIDELLPSVNSTSLNKRNLFDMFKVIRLLRRERFDVGFNPWSSGADSCYFITYCNYFLCYKEFDRPHEINHYQVIRRYLMLPEKVWVVDRARLGDRYGNILICPESTDRERSMKKEQIDEMIGRLRSRYPGANVILAVIDKTVINDNYGIFVFSKTKRSSEDFIKLIKSCDLVICVDSGPLHISAALGVDLMTLFYTTKSSIVLNSGTRLVENY